MKKFHFIAIGGSAMHNLALALHQKGFEISGSDDTVFEPSKSRLEKAGILPKKRGWFSEKITKSSVYMRKAKVNRDIFNWRKF